MANMAYLLVDLYQRILKFELWHKLDNCSYDLQYGPVKEESEYLISMTIFFFLIFYFLLKYCFWDLPALLMIDGRPTYQFKSWSFASAHTELFGDKSLSKHAYTLLEKQTPTKITHPLHQN